MHDVPVRRHLAHAPACHDRRVLSTALTTALYSGTAETTLEVTGVFLGGLSGGLAAVRKRLDVFGVLVLSWAAGLGGGILRDVLIGATPPVGITEPEFVLTTVAAGVLISFFHPGIAKMRRAIVVLDSGGLGLFVVVGTTKGLDHGAGMLAAVVVGTLTGVGGGAVRDLILGEVPLVLQDRQFYAIPAVLGSGAVVLLWHEGLLNPGTGAVVAVGIVAFRLLSLWRGWVVPDPQATAWPGPRARRGRR